MNEQQKTTSDLAPAESPSGWQGKHVYLMAIACLILGVTVGYFLRGSQSPVQNAGTVMAPQQAPSMPADTGNQAPSLDKMKQMADKAVAPMLEKLKSDPNNFEALNNAGKVYRATHQFKEASAYYEKALQVDPKSAGARTDLASCLYYMGDTDGALAQLDKALSYDPKYFGAMLNIGIIKLQAKNDAAGAVASWEKILKTDADPKFKEMVRKKISETRKNSLKAIAEPKT